MQHKLTLKGLKAEIDTLAEQVRSLSESSVPATKDSVPTVQTETVRREDTYFPYRSTVDKYFDPADGFDFKLDGLGFTIYVPRKFSNALDTHWDMHHSDKRHKVLESNDIVGGIEAYCELVVNQIGYQRDLVSK